jgi:hypothetical protein
MSPREQHAPRRWCVFVSAGDFSNVAAWVEQEPDRQWDLIVAFYGDSDEEFRKLKELSDAIFPIKGGKFPNLKSLWSRQPDLFSGYEFIMVADDDLIFQFGNLSQLFAIAARYQFSVSQPAFSSDGRISHEITRWPGIGSYIRIVNFVEITVPLFRADLLQAFLAVYDGVLVGWGIDWWFCQVLKSESSYRFAVLDEVVVVNPHDHQRRGAQREIVKLLDDQARELQWRDAMERYGLKEFPRMILAEIRRPRQERDSRRGGEDERRDHQDSLKRQAADRSEFLKIFRIDRPYEDFHRPDFLRDVAKVHWALGNLAEARRLLVLAASERPNGAGIRELLDRLEAEIAASVREDRTGDAGG